MDFFRPADEQVLREFYKEENFAHEEVDEVLDTRLIINELIKRAYEDIIDELVERMRNT
jgi:hypothetical protein